MAGYFISTSKEACEKAITIYNKKEITNYKILNAGKYFCVYFYKQNAQESTFFNDIYIYINSFIFGTGYYIYKNKLGKDALELIFHDLVSSNFDFSIFRVIKGHFNFILFHNQELYIVTDKTGNYHSYYSMDENNNILISTSFLSLCENTPKLTPTLQELLEYITLSTWQGYKTVFNEINKLTFGKVFKVINNSLNVHFNYYTLNLSGEHKTFDEVLQHITDYFSFLKNYDKNICCDLSGGADSRILLAAIHSQTHQYECLTVDNDNDLPLASAIAEGERIKLHKLFLRQNNISNCFLEEFIKTFYLFDMTRPMFFGALYGESQSFNYPYNRKNLIRFSAHAAELTRNYDWIFEHMKFIDFITNQYQIISNSKLKKLFIKNIIQKIKNEVRIDNENDMTYKDINKIYLLLRCRTWAGARITTSSQKCFHMFPFEDLALSQIFFNQDKSVIKTNFLLKKLMHYLYPELNKYPSCYDYSFEYDEKELDEAIKQIEREKIEEERKEAEPLTLYQKWRKIRHKAKHFLLDDYKFNRKYKKICTDNPDTNPYIISKEVTQEIFGDKPLIIKSLIKDLNITLQNDLVKDGIFSLEFLLRTYKDKLNIR